MRLYNRARIVARVEYVIRVAYSGARGVCDSSGVSWRVWSMRVHVYTSVGAGRR